MNSMRAAALLLLLASLGACASRPSEFPGLGYGPDCDSAVVVASRDPKASAIASPTPTKLFLPPLPLPSTVRGRSMLIDFTVDRYGKPIPASITIDGIGDAAYRSQAAHAIQQMEFRPATLGNCAVPGSYHLKIDLGVAAPVPELRLSALMDSIASTPPRDTTSKYQAYYELNIMTAPVDTLRLDAFDEDTVQWTAPSDSCGLVVRTVGPSAEHVFGYRGYWWYRMVEASGSVGPGYEVDMSLSPSDWKRFRYAHTIHLRLPADSARWPNVLNGITLSSTDLQRVARDADGSYSLAVAIVEGIERDPACVGDACRRFIIPPAYGSWPIRWTSDGRSILVGDRGDSSRWTAIDLATRKPIPVQGLAPASLRWATQPVATAFVVRQHDEVTGSGPYRFAARGDSIEVKGPDRSGRIVQRTVGPGVPVAVTKNGEYLLAVRRENGRSRVVIYAFRMFHAMMKTSCG